MRTALRAALRTTLTALALPILLASSLSAQQPRPGIVDVTGRSRQGFWVSLGFGGGAEAVNLDGDGLGYSDELTEPTMQLRIGGTLNQHIRLGGEFSSWFHSIRDNASATSALESVSGVFGIIQYYPWSRAGLYLKGGIGLGRSAVDYEGGPTISDVGFAAVVGAGYDIRLGRHFALTPTVDFQAHNYSGAQGGGYRERIRSIGLGVTYQAGGF